MNPWNDILFFEGENPDELRKQFVELSARWPNHTPFQVASEVFRKLRDPGLRALKAAEVWSNDLEVLEAIRQLKIKGPAVVECTEQDLIRRVLAIADDEFAEKKDRIAAIRLAGELQGLVKKSVESKVSVGGTGGAESFLAALAAKLPA
jgi:hypothetical protein